MSLNSFHIDYAPTESGEPPLLYPLAMPLHRLAEGPLDVLILVDLPVILLDEAELCLQLPDPLAHGSVLLLDKVGLISGCLVLPQLPLQGKDLGFGCLYILMVLVLELLELED